MPILNAQQLKDGMGPASLQDLAALKKELALLSNAVDDAAKEKEQQMIKQRQAEMAKDMVMNDLEQALLKVETARKDAVRIFEDLDHVTCDGRSVSSKASRSSRGSRGSRGSRSSTFSLRKKKRDRKIFKAWSDKNERAVQMLNIPQDSYGATALAQNTHMETRGLPLTILEETRCDEDTREVQAIRSRSKERMAGEVADLRKELTRLQNQLSANGDPSNNHMHITAAAPAGPLVAATHTRPAIRIRSAPTHSTAGKAYPHTAPRQVLFDVEDSEEDSLTAEPLDHRRNPRVDKRAKDRPAVGWLEWLVGDADSCCSCCSSSPSGAYSLDSDVRDLPLHYVDRTPSRKKTSSRRKRRTHAVT